MYKYLLLCILFCPTIVVGQNSYFNTLYNFQNWYNVGLSIENDGNNFVLFSNETDSLSTNNSTISFRKIDSLGNLLISKNYGNFGDDYYSGWVETSDKLKDGYIIGGGVKEQNKVSIPFLMKFNTVGDTLWAKKISTANDTIFQTFYQARQTADGGFIAVGNKVISHPSLQGLSTAFMVKTDSLGNIEWEKSHNTTNYPQVAWDVEILPDKGYLLGGQIQYSSSDRAPLIIRTDSLGNQIWGKVYAYNQFPGGIAYINSLKDGNFVIATYAELESNSPSDSRVFKINLNGDILWDSVYKYNGIFDSAISIKELENGNLACAGYRTEFLGVNRGTLRMLKANGKLLYTREYNNRYTPELNLNSLGDIVLTPDSGFAMVGVASGNASPTHPNQDVWVVKTNCLGFDAPPTAQFLPSDAQDLAYQFTNQSQNSGTYFWDFGDGTKDTLNEFNDSVLLHTFPDYTSYNVQLIAEACGDRDTVNLLVNNTPVGVSVIPKKEVSFLITISPNPNKGNFTITLGESYSTITKLTLYDVSGKTVYNTSLPANTKTHTLHLTLDNGVYIIRINNGNLNQQKQIIISN